MPEVDKRTMTPLTYAGILQLQTCTSRQHPYPAPRKLNPLMRMIVHCQVDVKTISKEMPSLLGSDSKLVIQPRAENMQRRAPDEPLAVVAALTDIYMHPSKVIDTTRTCKVQNLLLTDPHCVPGSRQHQDEAVLVISNYMSMVECLSDISKVHCYADAVEDKLKAYYHARSHRN